MSNLEHLSASDRELISSFGIDCEVKTVYFFEGYKYDKLKDAVRYAKMVAERKQGSAEGESHHA